MDQKVTVCGFNGRVGSYERFCRAGSTAERSIDPFYCWEVWSKVMMTAWDFSVLSHFSD